MASLTYRTTENCLKYKIVLKKFKCLMYIEKIVKGVNTKIFTRLRKKICAMKNLSWPSITESDKWRVDHAYKNSNQNNSA